MDTQTFGLRNRYQIVCAPAGAHQLSPEEAGRRLFAPVAPGLDGDGLLGNGGRLQLGVLSRPEYGTPRCDDPRDLVVHDKAGERILEGLLADTLQRRRAQGLPAGVSVFKSSIGSADASHGSQETYLLERRGDFGRLADLLIPFLVTRQLICGTGTVQLTPRGAGYGLSRPARIESGISGGIARSRPLISTRDDARPAAGPRRLRVSISDPNMSETTTLLKAGSTLLVLRLIEAGTVLPGLALDQPVQALAEVSQDITGRTPVRLAGGRTLSALQIQREYLAAARDFAGRQGLDAAGHRVLDLWQRALDAIAAGDLDAIAREIDWVIKYQLIERYRAAHDLPWSAPQVGWPDLAYHDISRRHGLYYQLQRAGVVDRTARDLDIFAAKTRGPEPGRYRQAG